MLLPLRGSEMIDGLAGVKNSAGTSSSWVDVEVGDFREFGRLDQELFFGDRIDQVRVQ